MQNALPEESEQGVRKKSTDAYRFTLKSGLEEGNLSLLKVAGSTHIQVRQRESF